MLIGHFPLLWFSSCPCERVLEVKDLHSSHPKRT
jgi:hypothetical protein